MRDNNLTTKMQRGSSNSQYAELGSYERWNLEKKKKKEKKIASNHIVEMTFPFCLGCFECSLTALPTDHPARGQAAVPAAAEVLNAFLCFLLYPFIILHQPTNFVSAHCFQFPSLRSRLGMLLGDFSTSCHAMCLPACFTSVSQLLLC